MPSRARMTQQQVAERMTGAGYRMHQTTVAKSESGERPVTLGEAVALALVLGVDLQDLLTEPARDELAWAIAERTRCEHQMDVEQRRQAEADAAAAEAQRRVTQARSALIAAERRVEALRGSKDQCTFPGASERFGGTTK